MLSAQKKPQLASLSFPRLYAGDLGKLEQWPWENTEDFKTKHFWIEVKNHMDAAGCKDFDELGSFALSLWRTSLAFGLSCRDIKSAATSLGQPREMLALVNTDMCDKEQGE